MSRKKILKLEENNLVARKIRDLRKLRGLTQAQFGELLGVSNRTISNWEKEVVPVPKSAIKNICREFDVTEDWLLGKSAKDPVSPGPIAPDSKLGRKEKKLLKEIEDLLESGNQAIIADLKRYIQMLRAWADKRK